MERKSISAGEQECACLCEDTGKGRPARPGPGLSKRTVYSTRVPCQGSNVQSSRSPPTPPCRSLLCPGERPLKGEGQEGKVPRNVQRVQGP